MTGPDAPYLVYSLLVLMFVASSLLTHRIPLGRALRMAAAWVAVITGAYLFALFFPDLKLVYQRVYDDLSGQSGQQANGSSLQLQRAEDGHFWVTAELDGQPVRLLVDSGASVTSLSSSTADALGLPWRGGLPVAVQTANGVVFARRTNVNSFKAGPILIANLPVLVIDMAGDDGINVAGMNLLSRLSRWTVEDQRMTWVAVASLKMPDQDHLHAQ